MTNIIIWPIGKYAGWRVDELPETYIAYAMTSFNLSDELKTALLTELLRRVNIDIEQIIATKAKEVRNKLAIKHHPDKGGSTIAMQVINEFYTQLTA